MSPLCCLARAAARNSLILAAVFFAASGFVLMVRWLFIQPGTFGFDLLSMLHWQEIAAIATGGELRFHSLRTIAFFPSLGLAAMALFAIAAFAAGIVSRLLPASTPEPAKAGPAASTHPPLPSAIDDVEDPLLAAEIAAAQKASRQKFQALYGATNQEMLEAVRANSRRLASQLAAMEATRQHEEAESLAGEPAPGGRADSAISESESGLYTAEADESNREDVDHGTDLNGESGYIDDAYGDSASAPTGFDEPTDDMRSDFSRVVGEIEFYLADLGFKFVRDIRFRSDTVDLVAIDSHRIVFFALWPFRGRWDCEEAEDRIWIRDDDKRFGSPVDRVYRERQTAIPLLSRQLKIDSRILLVAYPECISSNASWKDIGIELVDPKQLQIQLSQHIGEAEGAASKVLIEELRRMQDFEGSPWK